MFALLVLTLSNLSDPDIFKFLKVIRFILNYGPAMR